MSSAKIPKVTASIAVIYAWSKNS